MPLRCSPALNAAIAYSRRGWPVFPIRFNPDPLAKKYPLTAHGMNDATLDELLICEWWRRWPNAVPAIVTGEDSGIVALDIDIRSDGNGFDSLEELGVSFHALTPTTHTPQGGCALLFQWPGRFVKTIAGKLAPHVDIRGDSGSLIVPPSPGRYWDPHLGPDTLIAPMPEWMNIPAPARAPIVIGAPVQRQRLSRYSEAALDSAVKAIVEAPDGQQHDILNREVYCIAGLVAGGTIPSALALDALQWAAAQMRSYNSHRPWHPVDLQRAVNAAFLDGLRRPRHEQRP